MADGLERFGRALEGFSAGYRGGVPGYERDDARKQQAMQQERQFGLQERGVNLQESQFEEAKKMHAAQLQQIRATMLKEGFGLLGPVQNLIANMPEDQRGTFADQVVKPLSMFFGFATGDDPSTASMMTPDLMKTILTQPGSHEKLAATLPWLTPAQKESLRQFNGDPTKLFKAAEEMSKISIQQAVEGAQAKVAAKAKGSPAPLAFKDALAVLDDRERAAVTKWLEATDPTKVDQALLAMNVAPLGPEREKLMTAAKGFNPGQVGLTETLAGAIQALPEWAAKKYDIRQWATLPQEERSAFIQAAQKTIDARELEKSRQQGAGGVTAKSQATAEEPLYRHMREGQHVIDLKSDTEVDYIATKGTDLEKDSKRFKILNADQHKQWTSIKEMEGLFSEFEKIAPQLVKQPGMNKLQQIEMWAKKNLGVAGVQTDLDVLKGASLRVAKAMQGSAQALSDNDRKTIDGMLPTSADTADAAVRRLVQTYRILGHMKNAVLGQSNASEKVKEATSFAPDFSKAKPVR